MSEECVFCNIIQKKVPASFVYEDNRVVAFLSNYPVNEGHTLVVPKEHYVNVFDTPEDEVSCLFKVAKKMALLVREAFGAEGVRIVQNNERAAEQVIFHMHVHVIPMYSRNKFAHDGVYKDKTKPRSRIDLDEDAKKMQQAFQNI